jgi:hypothetical protein
MEEELGNGWAAGVNPDDWQRCYAAFCSAFDARRSLQLECLLRRSDGECRLTLCSGSLVLLREAFSLAISEPIDITDLQSGERFRQLAENIDEVFWMLDVDTQQVLYVSPTFEKMGPQFCCLVSKPQLAVGECASGGPGPRQGVAGQGEVGTGRSVVSNRPSWTVP